MTIVVALKVGDGLVLGADSASTLFTADQYHNSYFNTEKLIHVRDLPVGALTFGLGSLKNRSVSSLANELRARLSGTDPAWHVDPRNFNVEDVANAFKRYFYDELYEPLHGGNDNATVMGFLIGGYSSDKDSAEIWRLTLTGHGADLVQVVQPEAIWDCVWEGAREPIQRVLFGYSSQIEQKLIEAGVTLDDARTLLTSMEPLINGAMPIQDAVDLVHYFIDVTCGYVRFQPGYSIVAKPVDLAAITKHNGFKWVARKHYYPSELNT